LEADSRVHRLFRRILRYSVAEVSPDAFRLVCHSFVEGMACGQLTDDLTGFLHDKANINIALLPSTYFKLLSMASSKNSVEDMVSIMREMADHQVQVRLCIASLYFGWIGSHSATTVAQ